MVGSDYEDDGYESVPDGDADSMLHGGNLTRAEAAAAARPGARGRLADAIAKIHARAGHRSPSPVNFLDRFREELLGDILGAASTLYSTFLKIAITSSFRDLFMTPVATTAATSNSSITLAPLST